ncbi:hypothetical protein MtrunA17_Chr5g0417541 [Medicago truncatula]|uniref:Transmembrane protein n=1 Tax=Medicago truncatula TaxID=3880 RepID=A0A396HPZ5_MEDTR|nr:hypothetical protein MtrunA17_Chr5g0417541 [Medicago truncatula]
MVCSISSGFVQTLMHFFLLNSCDGYVAVSIVFVPFFELVNLARVYFLGVCEFGLCFVGPLTILEFLLF